MKRIGYIYKYNENEQKGILVYGHWKITDFDIQNKPVKFTIDDCKTVVKTGNLVYFELSEAGVMNIERASLANFDTKIIEEMITWKKGSRFSGWYFENTHITFEYLGDIVSPSPSFNLPDSGIHARRRKRRWMSALLIEDNRPYYNYQMSKTTESITLPDKIDDLFDYFGKFEHSHLFKYDSACVYILDMAFWIDEEIQKGIFYGLTVEQVSYLYDIFVSKKHVDDKGNVVIPQRDNDCISNSWKLILSHFNDDELRQIISASPMLQPALPYKFCIENLDVLHEEYGMPDVRICKTYNEYQITKTNLASEYKLLRGRFHIYANCGAKHLEGEGVPMCSMGERYIKKLVSSLEDRFESVIAPAIKTKFESISGISFDSLSSISQGQAKDALLCVGCFFDVCEDIINERDAFNDLYEKMPIACQNALYKQIRTNINKSIFEHSKNIQISPSVLASCLYYLQKWVDDSTKKDITQIVNERFAAIDDLEELVSAYESGFITEEQFYDRYCLLTKDFSINQLTYEMAIKSSGFHAKPYPLTVQWYIVSRIIDLFNFQSLDSYNCVKLDYGEDICNIKTLLDWIEYNVESKEVVKKAKDCLLSVLTEEEKQALYEWQAEDEKYIRLKYENIDYSISNNDASAYGRYGGSYAQDEMGYSDDDIDTIFDGDPSAYWNID